MRRGRIHCFGFARQKIDQFVQQRVRFLETNLILWIGPDLPKKLPQLLLNVVRNRVLQVVNNGWVYKQFFPFFKSAL